ncbi:RIP metalloprotease RseP [uncultured Prevotella sp.]|uniref:RIP metalloprotease RseP n=1 Tax=uncultured Prevotella sp. TaxID=159272 RepID=UPI00261F8E1B|nr:RIP metalloprotease RseP [uncultured Prevotella sp.]
MEIFLIKLLQFMLAISILVLLHEGGHFFFSKLFGVRVEKFFLFFDPWFHLFQFKPRKSDTTYGIGWLPLGGYCKIAGMIDESFDTEQMQKPAEPWEFRSKPAWQRLLIMIGGVLVNFLLALFLYAMCLFTWGDDYVKPKDMPLGMKFNKEAKALGFQDRDILVGTDQGEFKKFGADMFRDMATAHEAYVIRDGKQMSIAMPGDLDLLNMFKSTPPFMTQFIEARVDSVLPGSLAEHMGFRKGDIITSLNGKRITSFNDFQYEVGRIDDVLDYAKTHQDSLKALTVTVTLARQAGEQTCKLTRKGVLKDDLKFGYMPLLPADKVTHIEYGFFESFPAGIKYGCNVLSGYVGDMKYIFSAEGAKSLGGFGAIGSMFPDVWNWHKFWLMTAFLSIILAFMNILPIPALDGGHVLFLLYEMITRRKPSENFMIRAEYIGIGILMLLMIVANLNDVLRWIGIM